MSVLLLFLALGDLGAQLEQLRAEALPPPLAELLDGYIALATCTPVDTTADTPLAHQLAAEQLRGARLRGAADTGTVWDQLRHVELRGNLRPTSVLWPDDGEQWPGEEPQRPPLLSHCERDVTPDAAAELAHLEAAVGALATEAAEHQTVLGGGLPARPVLAYQAALLRTRLGRRSGLDAALVTALPLELAPYARLLVADDLIAAGHASEALALYAELEAQLPEQATAIRARRLIAADQAGDRDLALALTEGAESFAPPLRDTLVVRRLVELWRRGEPGAALAWATAQREALAGAGEIDAPWVERVLLDLLAEHGLDGEQVELLATVRGKARLGPDLLRIAALALSRQALDQADGALAMLAARVPRFTRDAAIKQAVVSLVRGDARELAARLEVLAEPPRLRQRAALELQSYAASDPALEQTARAVLDAWLAAPGDGNAQARAARLPVVVVPAAPATANDQQPMSMPAVPRLELVLPEAYALVPRLGGCELAHRQSAW